VTRSTGPSYGCGPGEAPLFPMTVSGKVRKVQMREESVQLLGLQDPAAARHA
jgi:hypothetical protein